MSASLPPALPAVPAPAVRRRRKAVETIAIIVTVGCLFLGGLQITGLIKPFSLPTNAMAPALSQGDQFYMEAITYLAAKPKRGEIVVFRTDQISSDEPHALYVKRLVGLPGDRINLSKGILSVNGQPLALRNRAGEIRYVAVRFSRHLANDLDTVTVPAGQYFVLGDNSTNSLDSRFFGCLPARSVLGRAVFCYWPPGHFGMIR